MTSDRHHRRQRPVRHGGADRPRREDADHAVRRSVGAVCARHAARQARGVSGAARRRASPAAVRAELPRQHLRLQDARRRADPVGERGRQPARTNTAARHRRARISSSIARRGRISTFFGHGLVAHVGFAHPLCARPVDDRGRLRARSRAPPCTAAAPTSAWKVRSSRRWPNRTSIGRGAWTSSA